MPSISSCPACHRELTIPDLADRQQRLRCPLCAGQFVAEDALADAVGFPPIAIIIDAEQLPGEAVESPVEATPPPTFGVGPIAETTDDLAWPSPVSSAPASAEGEPTVGAPSGEPAANLADDASANLPTELANTEMPEEVFDDISAPDDAVVEAASEAATEEAASENQLFDQQVASMRVAPKVRRQASPWSALGQLVGMALGGVLGLAIGYYVLLWIGGPSADFLKLRKKVPGWLLPPARRHNTAGEGTPLVSSPGDRTVPGSHDIADVSEEPTPSAVAAMVPGLSADDDVLPSYAADPETRAANSLAAETQPLARDPFAVASQTLPEAYRGPRGFKLRTAAEVVGAIECADLALRCQRCRQPGAIRLLAFEAPVEESEVNAGQRPCEYCRGKPVLNLTTAAFEDLCGLGEAVTFVQLEADDESARSRLRDAAETMLMAIGSQRDKSEIVGRLAGARLDDGGRQTNGIIVAGAVQQAQPEGELYAIQLMLFGCGKSVTVISHHPPEPPVARRDRLVVLGSIVDSPVDNLVGYRGDLPQIIWGGLQLKLAAAAQ